MTIDSPYPRKSISDSLTGFTFQNLHAEVTSERMAPMREDALACASEALNDAPPRRLVPYVSDARAIRDLIRSARSWQPGNAEPVEVFVAAWQFMEGLYQASRGGGTQPGRPLDQTNPQALPNRQAFKDAVNWAFQQAGSNWQIEDVNYPSTGADRSVRIQSGKEVTTINMSWDLQHDLRAARTKAKDLAEAIRLDLPGERPNIANVQRLWREIRGNARIANFIRFFANQQLHRLGYHLDRNGNNLLIKEWNTAKSEPGKTLHTID